MGIEQLIPQRDPIVMVDALVEADGSERAVCRLLVTPGNYFVDENGLLAEAGLVEHIAQSASAFAGYLSRQAGAEEPPVGYIGEVKKFHCYRRPAVGEQLTTLITRGVEVGGVSIVSGEVRVGDELVADTQLKIYMA